jgi:DNA/RNA-binding domain of Phe-tRNA-synthetase-like protein
MTVPIATLRIAGSLLAQFPDLSVGGFAIRGLDAAAGTLSDDVIHKLWMSARVALDTAGTRVEDLGHTPGIAEWRAAFATCRLKPSTFRSSVEALTRRVLKDGKISTPLRVVDAYCAVSVQRCVPLGSYDVDRLPSSALELRHINPAQDKFEPLGGVSTQFPMLSSVAAYTSGSTVLCWGFNHRDSRATCVQPSTRTAIFFGEALNADGRVRLEAALDALAGLFSAHGAHPGPAVFGDQKTPEIAVSA